MLCSLYLSLKCVNSENSFIFKNDEKRQNIIPQKNYTNKMKFCIWKATETHLKLNLLMDHLDGCTLTMCFTTLLAQT